MSPISSNDALEAGFVPAGLPPRALDGGLELSPAPVSLPVIQPMTLCELGPCRNHHRLVQKIDAQTPLDGTAAPIATAVIRTCYPSPGIEYDLTGEPIKECSLWNPMTPDERLRREQPRYRYTSDAWAETNQDREAYKAFLASWGEDPPK